MYLFYTPDIATVHELSEEESQHCVRVLRYTRGDKILLTDGKGTTFEAIITNPHPKHCAFDILTEEKQERAHNFHLHIAIAPTKNIERLEWMVEKCTEIGVDEITPLLCRFSERKTIREDRLEKVMLSAAKQSLTPYLPQLNPLTPYHDLINRADEQQRFIAHCYKEDKRLLKTQIDVGKSVLVLIGPEGDFSEEEVAEALAAGFVPVSLGNSRLRTETAGVVACHTAILINE
ncbi:MAG: 16S rRNA (uracil(1498)-N(3))-methyltransferase [Paludibacter sp.]|nr:16S rRNA (uracil(1498)-N(3))-methyltransferase [Bacteroidales bacterium]MCM1068783.1 16S rRNA (uracil(1498)-N(3))-methyltransferase [Prevotella sp.]MCM1353924.1 16S rRNA (uracil(1498)-N(3))-methyltransferase [Bacteroides sp.]MCM1443322.1 16S rRNA (uracil(1498)-N(3))-methyltransferase [Muribaculum sp.]MCM1482137.1 16S rRNA (uracil(1498)-N(3))-methyltransferase [Paludibacter sp.]